jgi:hypothetical protein
MNISFYYLIIFPGILFKEENEAIDYFNNVFFTDIEYDQDEKALFDLYLWEITTLNELTEYCKINNMNVNDYVSVINHEN